jgi:hypothetical protein
MATPRGSRIAPSSRETSDGNLEVLVQRIYGEVDGLLVAINCRMVDSLL